jgi:2-methylisocitrate lyase-like PEP mutase family enzyme
MTQAASRLREALDQGEFFVAPGLYDMMTARLAREEGFSFGYASGYWLTASAYGLPDVGIATYTQMLDRVETLVRTVPQMAIIADADTGYGGLVNMRHTMQGYARAGVAAIQIEDQEFPKRCGHSKGKRVVPTADMVARIRVACEARDDDGGPIIIARSDARAMEGMDAMLRRLDHRRGNRTCRRQTAWACDDEYGRWRPHTNSLGGHAASDGLCRSDLSRDDSARGGGSDPGCTAQSQANGHQS